MAVTTASPAVVEQKTANYFDLAYWNTINLATGQPTATDPLATAAVDVWWNAWQRDGDSCALVKNCGPQRYEGERLVAVAADADARTQAYKTQGVPAGLAEALGQRDALTAALVEDGLIPTA